MVMGYGLPSIDHIHLIQFFRLVSRYSQPESTAEKKGEACEFGEFHAVHDLPVPSV
jgi:hypothetical protein